MKRILFLLKDRYYSPTKVSYGLINSSSQIADYLTTLGNTCSIVTVNDSNDIDRECFSFKPDIVIIEALWVTAKKLHELLHINRYRHVQWIIRIHSDIGYLSTETQGLKHINDYINLCNDRLTISINNEKFADHLSNALEYKFTFLPNIITIHPTVKDKRVETKSIDIACFGALRLLKNQCFQAICAINAANQLGKKLYFHITPSLSNDCDPVLANLRELFLYTKHELVIHEWMDTKDFHDLISKMDIGLQLSYTESFNIVSADFINMNRLVLVSDAISWMPHIATTSTVDYDKVVKDIIFTYKKRNSSLLKSRNKKYLLAYNKDAKSHWIKFLNKYK